MELPRFQIGELFKVFIWIIVVAVPIGLYYVYYSDVQNRYDNQRNFRALNEVSSHLELHLQALGKLFLFTPVNFYSPGEKIPALALYKRRLQTNEFLQDLEVRDVNLRKLIDKCENTRSVRFFMNTQASHAKLKVYPCAKARGKTGIKTKNIQECLDMLSQNKSTSRLWKCFTDLNNTLDDKEQLPWLKDIHTGLSNKKRLQRLRELQTLYFELPIKSLLGANLPLEFDEILLSNNQGDVIFQKGSEVLEWVDKKTFLKTAHQGNSISNIKWLLQEASQQIEISSHARDKVTKENNKSASGKIQHIDFQLEHSTYVDLSIAGNDYRVYIHPFIIANTIHNTDKNADNTGFNKLYAVGIVEKDRLGGSVLSLPFIYFAVALLLLLLGFLSWPFLRLKFMGIKETISANDLYVMLLSFLFGLVVITLFLLTIFTFYGLEDRIDEQAKHMAKNINKAFQGDLRKVLNEMNEDQSKNIYLQTDPTETPLQTRKSLLEDKACEKLDGSKIQWHKDNYHSIFSCLAKAPSVESEKDRIFPGVRDIFVLDKQGYQYGPIIYFVERLFSSNRLWVGFRDYFKIPRDGKTWHFREHNDEVQPFYIERIYNFSDGNKASQVAMPIKSEFEQSIAKMDTHSPVVMASTTYFPSIATPVLPASFHFAIIENTSGHILYHSEDEKSFVEYLYAESDYNRHLISHAQMRFEGFVEGLYHGDATKFFVLPLDNLPWSIVVYYDLSRLHVLMVKTAVITLFSFILYLLPLLFLFIVFTKVVIKNWDWLWPHHLKSHHYTELIFILALFSVSDLMYVMFVSGWSLLFSLILSVPLILGMVWIFIGDRPYRNNYYHPVFWICCLILSLSLFPQFLAVQENPSSFSFTELAQTDTLEPLMVPMVFILLLVTPLLLSRFKPLRGKKYFQYLFWGYSLFLLGLLLLLLYHLLDLNNNLWYFQVCVTVILIILLAKYIFFPAPLIDHKHHDRSCPEICRAKYLGFMTLIYLPIAVIPTIGFYKDSFTVNEAIYSRLDQVHFAETLQKRKHTLDKYARMFYPSDFDKPDNKKRLILEGTENINLYSFSNTGSTPGIYGFTGHVIQADSIFCKESGDEHSVISRTQQGPADYFMRILLKINLQFAQQHVLNSDKLNNDGWCWKEQALNFTTQDSAGIMAYQINQQSPGLWTVIESDFPRLLMLLLVIGSLWWLLLSYFSRRVFGIYIPEPIRYRNSLPDQQIDLDEHPLNILIRGAVDKFLILLKNNGITVDPVRDVQTMDILTAVFTAPPSDKKILVIDNLDAGIQDRGRRKQALDYLEKQVNNDSSQFKFIFIRCEIAPLYRLINPSAYPCIHTGKNSTCLQPDIEEINRWSRLLANFKKHYCWEPSLAVNSDIDLDNPAITEQQQELLHLARKECQIWPELNAIEKELELIILDDFSGELNHQQVLEYIRTHANVFFRKHWELCTRDERLCLCQLAAGQFVNPANEIVIEHLYRRGYIKRAPYFRIASETFKHFVETAELIENPVDWEIEARKSVWASLKIPLFIILFCLTGILLYVASDTLDVTLGLLSGLLAFIPLLLRGVNMIKGGSSSGSDASTE